MSSFYLRPTNVLAEGLQQINATLGALIFAPPSRRAGAFDT